MKGQLNLSPDQIGLLIAQHFYGHGIAVEAVKFQKAGEWLSFDNVSIEFQASDALLEQAQPQEAPMMTREMLDRILYPPMREPTVGNGRGTE